MTQCPSKKKRISWKCEVYLKNIKKEVNNIMWNFVWEGKVN